MSLEPLDDRVLRDRLSELLRGGLGEAFDERLRIGFTRNAKCTDHFLENRVEFGGLVWFFSAEIQSGNDVCVMHGRLASLQDTQEHVAGSLTRSTLPGLPSPAPL